MAWLPGNQDGRECARKSFVSCACRVLFYKEFENGRKERGREADFSWKGYSP